MDRMSEQWVDFKVALRSIIFMVPDHAATEKQMLADRHDHLSCSSLSKEGWWVSQRVSVTDSDGQRGPQQTSKRFNLFYLWFVVSQHGGWTKLSNYFTLLTMLNHVVQELSPEITKQIWIMSCSLPLVLQESKGLNLEEEMLLCLGVVQTHRQAERDLSLFTGAPVVVQKPASRPA